MELVALGQLGDDGPLGVSASGCCIDRLVLVGVERLAERGDRLDAVLGQGGEQLLVDHVEPLGDPGGVAGAGGLGGAVEVVEPVEEVAGQGADGVDAVGVGLGLGPLLVVGELGAGPLELVEVLVALADGLRQLVAGVGGGRRRRSAGSSVGWWSVRSWFLGPDVAAGCRPIGCPTRRANAGPSRPGSGWLGLGGVLVLGEVVAELLEEALALGADVARARSRPARGAAPPGGR